MTTLTPCPQGTKCVPTTKDDIFRSQTRVKNVSVILYFEEYYIQYTVMLRTNNNDPSIIMHHFKKLNLSIPFFCTTNQITDGQEINHLDTSSSKSNHASSNTTTIYHKPEIVYVRAPAPRYAQERVLIYEESLAPVAPLGSIRIFVAVRSTQVISQSINDVKTAFLNGPLMRRFMLLKRNSQSSKSLCDNRPPMLEKDMYDSWKSRMELYMMNRQHGRMILESVENGPLIWPTIEENGVTRPKKYFELSATEAIQADCDIKETNIILQGLPPDVYALERECKLYDEFDKFAYKKGETLHPLALVATHQMTQSPYQTHQNSYQNSQFQPQVSLYQSPRHGSPYQSQQYSNNQSSTPLSIAYPSNDYQSSVHHNVYSPSSSIPQLEYTPTINQQPEFPQLDSGLIVPVFHKGDDPIDAIDHMMSFLTAVVTSRYPTTNNQLRNSSNPRQQATINDGRVTLQPV
ncbi:hypothetical protein Tco_0458937 [Tanacetum coccineum]